MAASTSSPCSSASPALAVSSRGSRPITACAVTDLPEPDSPTTHTISPAPTEKVMFSIGMRAVRAARQLHGEALELEDGSAAASAMCPHTRLAKRGSSVSRRPSPSMLMASTANARQMPG